MTHAELAQCYGKDGLPPSLAHQIARRAKTPSVPYRCRHCGAWHVGGVAKKPHRSRKG